MFARRVAFNGTTETVDSLLKVDTMNIKRRLALYRVQE